MFPEPGPRVFAVPPGADFATGLVAGLATRLASAPPEAMARVTVFLATERMRQRVTAAFLAQGPGLLPRLRLVADPARDLALPGQPMPRVRRQLILARLIAALLDRDPSLAPRTALFELAESLAGLLDEMQGEGVPPEAISALDVSEHSAHWARTQAFMGIVAPLFGTDASPDEAGRQRRAVAALAAQWQVAPPADPVLVAGSTGSRGATRALMLAVAGLPQGALVLPGFDTTMGPTDFADLGDPMTGEDHPQYRYRRLLEDLGIGPQEVRLWRNEAVPAPARNRLISLALRPAPVTDRWIAEGPALGPLGDATARMTLLEAPSPRAEALAIAAMMREAAEGQGTVALVTADRALARQVTAALDRWGIVPDDSAGQPLALTVPGRLLRQVAALFTGPAPSEVVLALLKHPLAASGSDRGLHLRLTHALELHLRRNGPPVPGAAQIAAFAGEENAAWANWVGSLLPAPLPREAPLAERLAAYVTLAERLCAGHGAGGSGALWLEAAGERAREVFDTLAAEAHHGGEMTARDFARLVDSLFATAEDVRESVEAHPRLMIWGTLEARVQGADLVILGGLNEGIWPASPPPDAWLNRRMRRDAGLLLPERQIGLAAHDFQQAVAARQVVLTRALRDAEAETVPSRWLNRLMNLMAGLPRQGGPAALAAMRARGAQWLAVAAALDAAEPVPPAPRPSPRPPVEARPRQLSVTQIRTLIRDPYAIYADRVLRLSPLDPLRATPDARLRGSVLHRVLERFVAARGEKAGGDERARLLAVAARVLAEDVPWPAARTLWLARIARAAAFFVALEARLGGMPVVIEDKQGASLPGQDFRLTARPDRLDLLPDGRVQVFDYKTGTPPTKRQQELFDKQLLLTAALVEAGAFPTLGPRQVAAVTYVGLGSQPKEETTPIDSDQIAAVWAGLARLIARYADPAQGYTARRAAFSERNVLDYDHLARFGEWDMTADPQPVVLP